MVDVHEPPPSEADRDVSDLARFGYKQAHLQAPEGEVFADEAPAAATAPLRES